MATTPTPLDLDTGLRPGDETSVPDTGPEALPIRPDARWYASLHRYQLYTSLMIGGDRVLVPPGGTLHPITGASLDDGSYLQRLPGETSVQKGGVDRGEDGWERRRDAGIHDPVAARIIWTYVDTLFRQTVDREQVRGLVGDDVLRDVDGRGTDAEDWLAWSYAQGLSQGWVLGQVDQAPSDPAEYASGAHQAAATNRPYLQLIHPVRVWRIEVNDRGEVTYALIHEAEGRWREWREDYSVVYEAVKDDEGKPRIANGDEVKAKGQRVVRGPQVRHNFGPLPPLVPFIANDPDPNECDAPLGESAMKATALVDLRILQHASLLDDLLRKTGFAILHEQLIGGPQETAEDYVLGNGFIFQTEGPVDWKAPPPDLARVLWEHLEKLESRAYKMGGVHRRSQDSVEAHSGLALDWESAPIYATVQRWARRLREWEMRLWRLVARGLGKEAPGDLDVIYPDDFSSRPVEQDVSAADALLGPYGSFDAAPKLVQTAVVALHRRAIRRLIGSDPDVVKALKGALVEDDEPDAPESQDSDTDDGESAVMAEGEAARAELEFKARMLEQLVKARAPQEVGRAVLRAIAADMGIDTPEVTAAIGEAMLEWYTTPPDEVGDLAELQGEEVPGEKPKKPTPPPSPFAPPQPAPEPEEPPQ